MNSHQISTKSAIADKAIALKTRMSAVETKPEFVAKVVHTSSVICKPDEFNIWHANADGVKGNGGDLPWGTLGAPK